MSEINKRSIISWCIYDWAHSAFPTIITTFIFSTYFMKAVAEDKITGTEYWSWALAASGITVAILAPIIGACTDKLGRKKPWLLCSTIVVVVATAMLFFTQPNKHWIFWALLWFAIADIAYELAQVFYNSLLVNISPQRMLGRISGWGWGLGYFGGLICLALTLVFFIKGHYISTENSLNVRAVTLLVAAWFAIFALPLFLFTQDSKPSGIPVRQAIRDGFQNLVNSVQQARKNAILFRFLIAHLIYIDGLNTLLAFGGIFAAGSFGMSFSEILIFGIVINLAAGIGAISFAWIDDSLGSKFTIVLSIIFLLIASTVIMLTHSVTLFWVCGVIIGIFCGPIQAASRSYLARIVNPDEVNEYFGLYALSGRLTAFAGPLILGALTAYFASQRAGIAIIILFLLIGGLVMLTLPNVKKGDA